MSPIHWFLVPFLLSLPLVVAWFQRRAHPERSFERRRLARWTFAFLALMLLLAGIDALGGFAWWYELPRLMTYGSRPAELCWIATFWLWMLAARALGRTEPQVADESRTTTGQPAAATPQLRAASLTSRRTASPLPSWAWPLLWLPWVATLAYLTVVWSDAPERERLVAVLILACQIPGLVVAMFTPRLVLREPEPLTPEGGKDLTPLYRRYRRRRLVGFFVLCAVMSLAFSGMAFALLRASFAEETLGLLGALGGSLIGLAGAGFGVWNGMERLKIGRELQSGS